MSEDANNGSQTRRQIIKYGGTVAAGTAVAGCADLAGQDDEASDETGDDGTGSGEASDTYSVTMEPMGTVTFDSTPERWVPYTGDYADMGVALGQGDGLAAIGLRSRYGSHYYEELPGVSVDKSELTALYKQGKGTGKEVFYTLDADVHVIDPNFMENRLGWDDADVTEIEERVTPFVGNTVFSQVYEWHDYESYSLYGAFEKMAELFQEQERYEAFKSYHDEIIADVEDRRPENGPDLAVLFPAEIPPKSFYPYLIDPGTQSKQWNDLGVGDALAKNGVTDAQAGGGTIDFETLLEIDPDAIAVRIQGETPTEYFEENIVSHLENHDVASELTAVQEGRVIDGGMTYQGPIIHLFQLEDAAQALYPEEFGGEQLFDRDRVADIINGEG